MVRRYIFEWAVLVIAVWMFSSGILDLGHNTRLPGNEAEIFQVLDWTLYNALSQQRQFPLWNPYLQTGLPFVADPMLHSYNPVNTLPVILLGVRDGFKLGLVLSYILAALGAWRLGAVLGMDRPSRLWVALMYAFAGQPVARFFQGQYLFIFGFAWIPWVVSSLFKVAKTRRPADMVLAILSSALLFFSGNVYYAYYMLFIAGLLSLFAVLRVQPRKPFLRIDPGLLSRFLAIGTLTLGVIAVQLFPLLEYWPRLNKSTEVVGYHSLEQIVKDYTSKDAFRPDAFAQLPAREEFYAYIGLAPFMALSLLPFSFLRRERLDLLFFSATVLFVLLWVNPGILPGYATFVHSKILFQFRHLLRILIYGSFALIFLAGLGIDALWKLFSNPTQPQNHSGWLKLRRYVSYAGKVALGAFLLISQLDLYQTHRRYVATQPVPTAPYAAMRWLRQHDPSEYYVRLNPNNLLSDAPIAANLRFIESWYHHDDIRVLDGQVNTLRVQARPNYVVQHLSAAPPELPEIALIQQIEDYNIYRAPQSLPYAFRVANEKLQASHAAEELQRRDVQPLSAFIPGPNRIEVLADGSAGQTLVLLTTSYPGWQVRVDGQRQPLKNVGGYLAVDMAPGAQKYTFSFRPISFFIGLFVSVLSIAVTFYLLFSAVKNDLLKIRQKLLSFPPDLREALAGFAARFYPGRHASWTDYADLLGSLVRSVPADVYVFSAALGVYLLTRFWGLERFPIYFFGDEAVQTLFAQDLLARKFHAPDGTLFPIYVEAAALRWTPLLSMYIHAVGLLLFGKSILVTRGASVLVGALGAVAVSLSLKMVFKTRTWWAGALLLAVAPAWFLHSRTAFETAMTTAFYACFLLSYQLYRTSSPRYLYAAIGFAAATFYTYSNAQAIVLAVAGLFFLSDLRYHLRHPAILLRGALLTGVLAIPFLNFRLSHPGAFSEHLRVVGSYLYQDISALEKIKIFIQKYAYGLSPGYWFIPNEHDLARHRMAGMGHVHIGLLLFVLIGLLICLRNLRSSPHRAVLLAALATPVGAALLDIGIARVLAFVIPASIMAGLGLEWVLDRLPRRLNPRIMGATVFTLLALGNLVLLRAALLSGPLWFRDYGLYGMQYGARQLFEEVIPHYLAQNSGDQILVSSTWANGTDNFIRFFLSPQEQKRVRMDGIGTYLFKRMPLSADEIFILTPAEYAQALGSPKIGAVKVEQVVPYPDGSPGFYLARLEYSEAADQIFAAEKEARRQLVESQVTIAGETALVRYSQIDMGAVQLAFDGDAFTLMRGLEANPFILEIEFPSPRRIAKLEAEFGLVNLQVTVKLYPHPEAEPVIYEGLFMNASGNNPVSMEFPQGPDRVAKIHFEFLNVQSGDTANIHIRELKLFP